MSAILASAIMVIGTTICIIWLLHFGAIQQSRADAENLKVIALAVEHYAVDYHGYPKALSDLVPKYLTVLPTVPGKSVRVQYRYDVPAIRSIRGPYDVRDNDSMDPTTLGNLKNAFTGRPCKVECHGILFNADVGFLGTP